MSAQPSQEAGARLRQPWLGIASTIGIVSICLVVSSMLPVDLVTGWVGVVLTATVPTLIVQTAVWQAPYPGGGTLHPLKRGSAGLLILGCAGAIISTIAVLLLEGGQPFPSAQIMMPLICSVPVTLWLVFLLDGWPFATPNRSRVIVGIAILFATYFLTYAMDRLLSNYSFMMDDPTYVPGFDPHGPVDARTLATILVGSAASTLALSMLDQWPLQIIAKRAPVAGAQPAKGIAGILLSLAVAASAWWLCVKFAGMNGAVFQAEVCVAAVFGLFVLLVLFENGLFASIPQPGRGLLLCLLAAILATLSYQLYAWIGLNVAGADDAPPRRALQAWIATVMLAITFPAMSIYTDLFRFWPLRADERRAADGQAGPSG